MFRSARRDSFARSAKALWLTFRAARSLETLVPMTFWLSIVGPHGDGLINTDKVTILTINRHLVDFLELTDHQAILANKRWQKT